MSLATTSTIIGTREELNELCEGVLIESSWGYGLIGYDEDLDRPVIYKFGESDPYTVEEWDLPARIIKEEPAGGV